MKRYILFNEEELTKLMNGEEIKHCNSDVGTLYFMSKETFVKSIDRDETDKGENYV